MVLLAVDCQKALVTDHLLRSRLFIQNVKDMIAAAILLLLAGVGINDIVRDYMLTNENNKERFEQSLRKYPEQNMDIVIPHEEYMKKFIDMFRKEYQTAENYLLQIGLSDNEVMKIKGKLITAQE